MTKHGAANIIICYHNLCAEGCPLFDTKNFYCCSSEYSTEKLIRIARKEYARKSVDPDFGKQYRQEMYANFKLISGATVL